MESLIDCYPVYHCKAALKQSVFKTRGKQRGLELIVTTVEELCASLLESESSDFYQNSANFTKIKKKQSESNSDGTSIK